MDSFLISLSTVGIAEIGDRTQLLSLMLAARFRKPWPIIAGILCATLANHAGAGLVGAWLGHLLTPFWLDLAVGLGMIAMALWTLKPDHLDGDDVVRNGNAFLTTVAAFFVAEIGDKTQIATLALAAAYPSLVMVIAGSTAGLLIANAPAVFLGKAFADRLPIASINKAAAILFGLIGLVFLAKALFP
ncbi:MAG TPA: TMEM165/GDT1 family protein [Telmatospirillum sp.]|nr:TMEM165/GDT1 family protein [Telmatospirillum sp.]